MERTSTRDIDAELGPPAGKSFCAVWCAKTRSAPALSMANTVAFSNERPAGLQRVNSGRSSLPPESIVASPCLTESPVGLFLLGSQRANPVHQPLNRRNARNKDDNCTDDQKRIHRAPLIVAERSNLPDWRRQRWRDARDED